MQLLYMLYQDDLDSKHMRPLSIEVKHLCDSGEVSSIGLLLGRGRYEICGPVGKGAGQTWPILPLRWGRSMGAVTALLHADRDHSIAGMVCASGFGFFFLVSSLRRTQDSSKKWDSIFIYTRSWTVPSVTYGSLLGNLLKACLGSLKMVPFEGEWLVGAGLHSSRFSHLRSTFRWRCLAGSSLVHWLWGGWE